MCNLMQLIAENKAEDKQTDKRRVTKTNGMREPTYRLKDMERRLRFCVR